MELLSDLIFDDPLFNMATVLTAGIIGGELFAKIKLPKVTGWIATGILLRQLSLPGMDVSSDPDAMKKFLPYMNFVLGFIAFTVGASLYFNSLRNTSKRVGFLLLTEAFLHPLIVGSLLFFIGPLISAEMTRTPAFLLATIAIAGAPGTTVLVIQEARAKGILTRTLLAAIGLIDMVAVACFVFVSNLMIDDQGLWQVLGEVGGRFLITFSIGGLAAVIAVLLVRTVVKPAFLGPLMVAVVLGSWGAAAGYGISGGILACTFAGIVLTNLRHEMVRAGEAYLTSIGGVLFALFFTFAGMKLDFTQVPNVLGLVILYFAARLLAKFVSAYVAMYAAGVTDNVRNLLGLALLPHGGVAVGLILIVQNSSFPEEVQNTVTTVGLAALAINQLIGPSATRFSLTRAGEAQQDRPRLLDFLDEQHIVLGLSGSREEIVKTLAEQLYATSQMEIPQAQFVQQVLERDAVENSCLGKGLMIPNAILEEVQANDVRGVLGLSSPGIDLDAPDGRVVHAVLLLATPAVESKRHLEVIAAFASAITKDISLREQLYHARSAAHAYEVIHAEDLTELNYFLEDAQERAGIIQE